MLPPGSPQEPREMWDWEIFQDDWWKTSFRAISWAYKTKPDHPRPPHYHDLLARGRRRRIAGDARRAAGGSNGDVSLNSALCGVRAAEEALRRYELEVAILSSDDLPHLEREQPPCPDTPCSEGTWNEKVHELLGGILELGALPEVDSLALDIPLWDLNNLDSPPSSPGTADLTDSEASGDSDPPPSTPKPTKASYARIVSSDPTTSPTVLSPLPSKLLSAAALTFIPSTPNHPSSREPTTPPLTSSSNSSDSPFSSPTYNFHFPSLNSSSPADRRESRSLPPSLQKDEAGFYIEVADDADDVPGATQSLGNTRSTTPRRPSAAFLPAFLTDGSPTSRSRNSKTREIVDRLRSSGSASSGRKAKKSNKRQASASNKDADLSTLVADVVSTGKEESTDGWISGVVRQNSSSRFLETNDGWITQVSQAQQALPPAAASSAAPQQQPAKSNKHSHGHGHGHKRSSGSNASHPPSAPSATFSPASSTMSLTVPHTPASGPAQLPPMPPLYPGVPGAAAPYPPVGAYPGPYVAANPAAYMHAAQMQYHHHPQAVRGPWPVYQPGMYPIYQPFGVMPAAMPYGMVQMPVAAAHHGSVFYDGNMKGKPAAGALVQ
uniref:Uncharacterized protein n=1 Tax=Ganoderma boninense TaxID=34458 RepID=A0A5K1JT18_9APHY|nr:Uncharacterized protein [Ganoderma boninense]